MKRFLAGVSCALLALTGCGGREHRLTIATGGTTGVYYVYGGGLAAQLTASIPGVRATAVVTSASLENIRLLGEGRAEIGFSQTDAAADAVNGTGRFTARQPVAALARVYDNYAQVVVAPGVRATTLAGLRGLKVSLGPADSGTQVVARRMLQAAGLDPDKDVRARQLSIDDSVQAIKDGVVDAFFWVGGVPSSGVVELTTGKPATRLLDTGDVLRNLSARFGATYVGLDIDLSAYQLPGKIRTVGVANVLLVPERMDERLAYDITRTLFERKIELSEVHPAAEQLDLRLGQRVEPIPLHPGAARYFRERNG